MSLFVVSVLSEQSGVRQASLSPHTMFFMRPLQSYRTLDLVTDKGRKSLLLYKPSNNTLRAISMNQWKGSTLVIAFNTPENPSMIFSCLWKICNFCTDACTHKRPYY